MGAVVQTSTGGSEFLEAFCAKASANNREAILPSGIFSFFCKDLSPSRTGFSKSKVVLMQQMLSTTSSDVNPAPPRSNSDSVVWRQATGPGKRPSLNLHQTTLDRENRRFGAGFHAELCKDVADMRFDGEFVGGEDAGDILVG
jgi:hypothetical protein